MIIDTIEIGSDISIIQLALRLWVVEFSLKEGILIRTLANVLKDNINNVRKNEIKDFLPVGLFNSREEAEQMQARLTLIISDKNLVDSRWQRVGDILGRSIERMADDERLRGK